MSDASVPCIRIVPDAGPNAPSTRVELPPGTDLSGHWLEVATRIAPHIPEGWHLVALGDPPNL